MHNFEFDKTRNTYVPAMSNESSDYYRHEDEVRQVLDGLADYDLKKIESSFMPDHVDMIWRNFKPYTIYKQVRRWAMCCLVFLII